MKPNRFLAMTVLVFYSLAAVANGGNETEIKETMNGLEKALNTSDISELQKIYSDEAQVTPANAEVLNDLPSIATFWNNRLSEGKSIYNIDVIDLQINDNVAYISALWSATVTTDGAHTEIRDGYLSNELERNTDGNWKIRVQNWN